MDILETTVQYRNSEDHCMTRLIMCDGSTLTLLSIASEGTVEESDNCSKVTAVGKVLNVSGLYGPQ
jgi:hypothetical protein